MSDRTLALGGVLELFPRKGRPLPFRGVKPGRGLLSVSPSASTCVIGALFRGSAPLTTVRTLSTSSATY